MKADEAKLLDFLNGSKQFIIPIYQRTYSWTRKQCEQLWKDIKRAATDETVKGHFIGSIVYIDDDIYTTTSLRKLLVIDGQQRLTSLTLLLIALRQRAAKMTDGDVSPEEIDDYYLINRHGKGELRYKLLLTQNDTETLVRLVDGKQPTKPYSHRIVENYLFFEEMIATCGIDPCTLYKGIDKLIIVDVVLTRGQDNPQLIFESMNSTGLDLSQADLIRNYVLMGQPPQEQTELYTEYWHPMEKGFGQEDYLVLFDRFMRDYLTVKTGRIPNIREVYEAFKVYAQSDKAGTIREIVADIAKYAAYFVRMVREKETDKALRQCFGDINDLKVDVAFPFLLEVYDDYAEGRLGRDEFVEVLRLVESYVFRRAI